MTNYILHQQEKSRQQQLLFCIALLTSNSNSAGEVYKTVVYLCPCADLLPRLCQVRAVCPQKANGDKMQSQGCTSQSTRLIWVPCVPF
jgi:hypothetical protein